MSKEFSCEYAMSAEVQHMSHVTKGCDHGPAPIPEEGKWIQSKQITDISGYTHGIGWCAPQQPMPCVKPEISVISFAFTHFASSGIGAAP